MPTGIYIRKPLSQETKQKIAESLRGRPCSEKMKEHLRSLAISQRGQKRDKELIERISSSLKGKKCTEETRRKISFANSGPKSYMWKGGITPIHEAIRKSTKYKEWRKVVFERDKYVCVIGGIEHGKNLHADHIKPFSTFPELRFSIENGRTLCVECHKKTDTYGVNKKI